MTVTRKLAIPCPQCGSADVFYSCTPGCCYNHVCAGCGTTFEPGTVITGGSVSGKVQAPDPLPDATDCTTECAKCCSNEVYVMEDGGLVCGQCGVKLRLEINEVAPGT